jgi:hypothetical protein
MNSAAVSAPGLRQKPHYCAAPFPGEDAWNSAQLAISPRWLDDAINRRNRPAALGTLRWPVSFRPCSAGTSLDSFQSTKLLTRSLELLEKTVFSFASRAGLTYPMDDMSRERSFLP